MKVEEDMKMHRIWTSDMQHYFSSCVSCLLALLSGLFFFRGPLFSSLVSAIIATSLDPLRAQLLAALLMTAAAALIAAMAGRRRLAALLGAAFTFFPGYLAEFIQHEQQPAFDPMGNLEPLNGYALLHTSAVMIGLALLCAFLGAAVGKALGEVLLDPPYQFARLIWLHATRLHAQSNSVLVHQDAIRTRIAPSRSVTRLIGSWMGAAMLLGLLVLASDSSDLFLFSPDIGLHFVPTLYKGHEPMHGIIVQDAVSSRALGGQKRPFLVYLPPSYNTFAGRAKHYPTLYLLHGSPGGERDWLSAGKADQAATTLITLGKIPELILVLPDGNGRPDAPSEWGNSFDHLQNIETFIAADLVTYVDHKYRTTVRAAYRGIGGLSMGGFGAANIAVHHPDLFGFVLSLGGYYHAEGSIWGKQSATLRANSPAEVLPFRKQSWKIRFYLGAATKDQPYYAYTKQFAQELAMLHIPYAFDLQNGYHAWTIWQVQIYHALLWLHWG